MRIVEPQSLLYHEGKMSARQRNINNNRVSFLNAYYVHIKIASTNLILKPINIIAHGVSPLRTNNATSIRFHRLWHDAFQVGNHQIPLDTTETDCRRIYLSEMLWFLLHQMIYLRLSPCGTV
jgi:hypothetical protein